MSKHIAPHWPFSMKPIIIYNAIKPLMLIPSRSPLSSLVAPVTFNIFFIFPAVRCAISFASTLSSSVVRVALLDVSFHLQ